MDTVHTFRIGNHFLPAIFNADSSGLDDRELATLTLWETATRDKLVPIGKFGYFTNTYETTEYARCEITNQFSLCTTINLIVHA